MDLDCQVYYASANNKDDPIEKECARVLTPLNNIFRHSRAANSTIIHGIWCNFELIQGLMFVVVTVKNNDDPIKNEGAKVWTKLNIIFSDIQGQLTAIIHLVEFRINPRSYSCPWYCEE